MKYGILLWLSVLGSSLYAQNDADWVVSVEADREPEWAVLVFSATLPREWDVYGSNFEAPIGPLPTTVALQHNESYEAEGTLQCKEEHEAIDPAWSVAYTYCSGQAEFRQRIKLKRHGVHIRGVLKGQYLNKRNKHLLDFEKPFDIVLR
jgi:hypothetical protein